MFLPRLQFAPRQLAQATEGPVLQAPDVHLRDALAAGRSGLRQVAEEAQLDDLALALGQPLGARG